MTKRSVRAILPDGPFCVNPPTSQQVAYSHPLNLLPYKRYLIAAAVVVAAFCATGYVVGRHYRGELTVAQDSVRTAHAALTGALVAARAESAWAVSLSDVATKQTASAKALAAKNVVLTDSANVLRGKYLAAVKVAPDTCTFVVSTASSLVQSVDAVNSALRVELDTTRASRDGFRASADSARAAFATLSGPVARVDNAATSLAKASKEPWLSRITPKPMFGGGVLVTPSGAISAGLFVGFGWKI